jgi:hypothetical protein
VEEFGRERIARFLRYWPVVQAINCLPEPEHQAGLSGKIISLAKACRNALELERALITIRSRNASDVANRMNGVPDRRRPEVFDSATTIAERDRAVDGS